MNTNDICCPEFNVEKWNNKTFTWDQKPFIIESIPALFHIPFPPMIGSKITKMMKSVTEANKLDPNKEDTLILFQDPSPFKTIIYFGVTGEVPGANNVSISGTFATRVYDGPFEAAPKFIQDMNSNLVKEGRNKPKDKDYFIHYAYCPKCAEKYKHNYMILFAKIS